MQLPTESQEERDSKSRGQGKSLTGLAEDLTSRSFRQASLGFFFFSLLACVPDGGIWRAQSGWIHLGTNI